VQTRVHLKIIGLVQGVAFRAWSCRFAESLGLTGWVKNCPDGSVEAEAQGSPDKIREFILACHQGPAQAQVKEIKTKTLPNLGAFEKFEIRY